MKKVKLPIKTEIAAWWLIVVGLIGTIATIAAICIYCRGCDEWCIGCVLWAAIVFVIGLLYFLSGMFLARRTMGAWAATILILIIELAAFAYYYGTSFESIFSPSPSRYPYTPIFFIFLIPLILLILDRKNYFEMVRQRELEKKDNG
jgi:hypothetical protein